MLLQHILNLNRLLFILEFKSFCYKNYLSIDLMLFLQFLFVDSCLISVWSHILFCVCFRDKGEVLTEALKIMLCDDRQHDMQRAAAFIKRLATFSLCFGSAESMAGKLVNESTPLLILGIMTVSYPKSLFLVALSALTTLRHLLLKNVKCRNLLENDEGGGSVSGGIAVCPSCLSSEILEY